MNQEKRMRLKWINMNNQVHNTGVVCYRCGVSRPALRKWIRRFHCFGEQGLESASRRPHRSPHRKLSSADIEAILDLRQKSKIGTRRLQNELYREQGTKYSFATIHTKC